MNVAFFRCYLFLDPNDTESVNKGVCLEKTKTCHRL